MKIIVIISLLTLVSCSSPSLKSEKPETKSIKSEINVNVETLGLIFYLADSSVLNEGFPESAHLIRHYTKQFSNYKSHPTVSLAKRLINEGILEASTTSVFGLYFTDLPEFKQKYDIDYTFYSSKEIEELKEFFKQIQKFYIDAEMDKFFTSSSLVYDKIQAEITTTLPDSNYINLIEKYHGIQMYDYVIVPSIFIPNYFNFGPRIKTTKGIINYFLLGPAYDIKVDSMITLKKGLGFDEKEYVERLGIHEFGHTFVRFIDEENYQKMIESISFLNTKRLQEKIAKGYGNNWRSIFEEHIVRLIETRIAKESGNEIRYNQLMAKYINEQGFVYIRPMSGIIAEYEQNRNKYQNFEVFFPILIENMRELKDDE